MSEEDLEKLLEYLNFPDVGVVCSTDFRTWGDQPRNEKSVANKGFLFKYTVIAACPSWKNGSFIKTIIILMKFQWSML